MENSSSKIEAMRPVILKAGIPLAITLASCVFAKIATRKCFLPKRVANGPEVDSRETNKDEPCVVLEADHTHTNDYYHTSAVGSSIVIKDEVLGLKRRILEIQDREVQLEKRFLYYQELKDQEMVLMELHNKFSLETNRVEFLGREISLLEAENQRFENFGVELMKVLRMFEFSGSENEQIRVRAKTLLARTKEQSRVLRKQSLRIKVHENEISKNRKDLEAKDDSIRLMEDEIMKLKIIVEILQEEKTELSNKLSVAEESAMNKVDEENKSVETCNVLAREVERMEQDGAGRVRELVRLRWRNACLRHELMRRSREDEDEKMDENDEVAVDYGGIEEIEQFGSDSELKRCDQFRVRSRRRRLIAKFKSWVEGGEKGKHNLEEENANKCFSRQRFVCDGEEETCFLGRKSCSSAQVKLGM